MTKLSRLEPEQQAEAAGQLVAGEIKSVNEYTADDSDTTQEENYYCSGAFIVDSFSLHNNALYTVPESHKLRLDNYREILSPEQIKSMICIAEGSIKMLQKYVAFLNNELQEAR